MGKLHTRQLSGSLGGPEIKMAPKIRKLLASRLRGLRRLWAPRRAKPSLQREVIRWRAGRI
jgi:hypothetical protein